MAQTHVSHVATDNLEGSVTLLIGSNRVEFFLRNDFKSERVCSLLHTWLNNGWHNMVVAQLAECSCEIQVLGTTLGNLGDILSPTKSKKRRKGDTAVTDFRTTPSAEYPWTVIATTAKSLSYNGERRWFRTQGDATEFAGEVFEQERNQRGNFDLAIVQCQDVVRPKPQVQMISTFTRSEPKILQSKTNELGNDQSANG